MLPKLETNENGELGYETNFEKLFPNFVPYLQNVDKNNLIEVNFSYTDEENQPNEEQLATHEFLLVHSNQMLKNLVEYMKQDEEYFLECYGPYKESSYQSEFLLRNSYTQKNGQGFPVVNDMYEIINYFNIGTINIGPTIEQGISYIGFSGNCTWEEEHGFGVAFHKLELLDISHDVIGQNLLYSRNEKNYNILTKKFNIFPHLESLDCRKERFSNLSKNIQLKKNEDYEEIFNWLIHHKMIYGYRNTPVDINSKEKVVLLNEIEELSFWINEITSVPNSIYLLENLTSLNFTSSSLEFIPKQIFKLTTLKSLSIHNNTIIKIPKDIQKLINLCHLNLRSNLLFELPNAILELSQLEKLSLDNNQFSIFPDIILGLDTLTVLNMSSNKLITIPESIVQLKHLERLDLRFNKLSALPSSVLNQMPNLKSLFISGNEFSIEDLERIQNIIHPDIITDINGTLSSKRKERDYTIKLKQIEIKEKQRNKAESENTGKSLKKKFNYIFISALIGLITYGILFSSNSSKEITSSSDRKYFNERVKPIYHSFYKGVVIKKYTIDNDSFVDIKYKRGTLIKLNFPFEKQNINEFLEIGDSIIKKRKKLFLEVKGKELDTIFYFKFDKIKGYKDYSKTNEFIIESKLKRNANTVYN